MSPRNVALRYIEYSIQLNELFNYNRYVSHNDFYRITTKYGELNISHKAKFKLILQLASKMQFRKAINAYRSITNINSKLKNRESYNSYFIKQEQQRDYYSDNQKLDKQQIEAIVACEDASLVLAPAGSGKTISLLAKIEYLVNTLGIPTDKILAISFTRKTVKELKDRVGINGVNINTFHSLGNKILKRQLTEKKGIIQEKQIYKFIKDSLNNLIEEDQRFAKSYNDYLLFYYSTPVDLTQLISMKDTVEFNKSFLRQTLQSVSLDKKGYNISGTTLNREFVKSKEEQIIANWLFINQIPYEYEKQYEHIDTKYKPDFTLTMFDEPLYLEHFALQKDGTSHFNNYTSGVEWKRALHKENNTILLESYTYQWKDGTLLNHIENEIKSTGLKITRLAEDKITEIMEGSSQYSSDIKSFYEVLVTFLMLQKNGMLALKDIDEKIADIDNEYLKRRAELFFEIYKPIYLSYERHLKNNNMIDFADMINCSIEIVNKSNDGNYPYDYILIDEVQDLSSNRYKLIKALLSKNPNSKLFAVGDDWQSIFRFAGGDLSLIQDFENTFELNTRRSFIGMTHRFGDPQLKLSSKFVQKNPYQSQKKVYGTDAKQTPIVKRFFTGRYINNKNQTVSEEAKVVDSILDGLQREYGKDLSSKSIQIISRYNWDIDIIKGKIKKGLVPHKNFRVLEAGDDTNKDEKETLIEWKPDLAKEPVKLAFCSMHKAKGITRDIVIVLNMNAGSNGMPSSRSSDPLIELLLAHTDQYPFAEERRLFYVAITRAKEATYVIADKTRPSQFLFEIFDDLFGHNKTCPICKVGEIVERNGQYGMFYSCSNFKYGCNYTNNN